MSLPNFKLNYMSTKTSLIILSITGIACIITIAWILIKAKVNDEKTTNSSKASKEMDNSFADKDFFHEAERPTVISHSHN